MTYDPNSNDAMLSRIMERMDNLDHVLDKILSEVRDTNGRVTRLETARAVTKGQIAAISVLASGVFTLVGWVITTKL